MELATRGKSPLTQLSPVAWVALATVVFWLSTAFVLARAKFGGDPRGFLFLGSKFPHPQILQSAPMPTPWGYDGQFYVALATDPFCRQTTTRQALDNPYYRAGRILVPLLAWGLAVGDEGAAVWAYLLVAWALGLFSVPFLASWLKQRGANAYWALLLVPNAGLVASLTRTTVDAPALTLLLLALSSLHSTGSASLWFALATLARESALAGAFGSSWALFKQKKEGKAAIFLLVSFGAFGGWHLLRIHWLCLPQGDVGPLAWPFSFVPLKVRQLLKTEFADGLEVVGGVAILLLLAGCVAAWPLRSTPEGASFLTIGLLGACLSFAVYEEVYAYSRALMGMPFLALPLALSQTSHWRRSVLLAVPMAFALLGLLLLRGETMTHGGPWAAVRAAFGL